MLNIRDNPIARNNNYLPSGYKVAKEEWKDQKSKANVTAIATNDDDDIDEFLEIEIIRSLPARANLEPLTWRCCAISNNVESLSEDDQDDEDEITAALQQLTPHVNPGPKLSRAQRKATSYNKRHIADIDHKVKNGLLIFLTLS